MTNPAIPDPLKVGREVLASKHRTTLETGIYMGGLLIVLMIASLFVATHMPGMERYALERNAVCYALFVIFMSIPIARFFNRPVQMFGSALIGWIVFVVGYDVAGIFYPNLFQLLRHEPFLALIEGAVVYGVTAVGAWVLGMVLVARHVPIAPRRRRTDHLHQQP